jgi:hypothetical protein|nr:MAG: hypothetical protein TU36_03330 [Vulcanisaeta sp. AZ3]
MDPKLRKTYTKCIREISRGLLADLVNDQYDYLMIDLASITYGIKNPREFLYNIRLAIDYNYLKPIIVFILDNSKPQHKKITKTRIKWLTDLSLNYELAEDEPAEIKAAKLCLEKGKCIVLSRDYDPLTIINEMLQPIKTSERAWIVRKITIDRTCLNDKR